MDLVCLHCASGPSLLSSPSGVVNRNKIRLFQGKLCPMFFNDLKKKHYFLLVEMEKM